MLVKISTVTQGQMRGEKHFLSAGPYERQELTTRYLACPPTRPSLEYCCFESRESAGFFSLGGGARRKYDVHEWGLGEL